MNIIFKTVLSATLLTLVSANVFSSPQGQIEPHKHTHKDTQYVKPGAAVSLSHNYDGQTFIGEIETLSLTLNHIYTDGHLTATILPSPHLQIASSLGPYHAELTTGSELKIDVRFSAIEPGTHNLGLETIYEDRAHNHSRRVISIPIYLGSTPQNKSKTKVKPSQARSSQQQGIIALPATETIR